MKYLLILLLFAQPALCYSQLFVGESKKAITSFLEDNNVKVTEMKLSDTTYRLSWKVDDRYQHIVVFDTNDMAIKQTIIPEKDNVINEFVRRFNKEFVIISDTEWRNYDGGRIYKIELIYLLDYPLFSVTLTADHKGL